MKALTYSKAGIKKGETNLPSTIFAVEIKADQLKDAYNRFLSNIRTNNAKTLKRGEVSGGGKKPWRQKGTGRARFGSSRNPIWRHGGIAFGPTGNENYTKEMPKNMVRSSIRQALSVKSSSVKVVESFYTAEYKTKNIITLLDKIGAEGLVLLVASKLDSKFIKSARNIPGVKLLSVKQINVTAILDANVIVFDAEGLKELEDWLKTAKKPAKSGDKK